MGVCRGGSYNCGFDHAAAMQMKCATGIARRRCSARCAVYWKINGIMLKAGGSVHNLNLGTFAVRFANDVFSLHIYT